MDSNGKSGSLVIAAGFAAADGPLPFGDAIATGIVIYDGYIFVSSNWGSITGGAKKVWNSVFSKKKTNEKYSNKEKNKSTKPKVKYPGNNPNVSPGKDWEWRGPKDKGSWYNPKTGETLHPDLNHPAPEGPHWDYIPYKNGPQYRIQPDGSIVPK